MKKTIIGLVLAVSSIALVSCGNSNSNNDVVVTPESSSSSTTTSTIDVPSLIPTSTTTPPKENDSPAITVPGPAPKAVTSGSGSIGRISIPSIGVDWPIYDGVDLSVLDRGPGHYLNSPKPCRAGNAAIAGHRTTHGAPFNKLDLLKSGDLINITTPAGDCTYKYLKTEIVSPTNISVVMPKAGGNGNLLTLTACHPKGSAAQRIVVTATLENVVVH